MNLTLLEVMKLMSFSQAIAIHGILKYMMKEVSISCVAILIRRRKSLDGMLSNFLITYMQLN